MGAFDFSSESYHEDGGKYGAYNIGKLEALTQNTPSQPTGGTASQGALEPSLSGGAASPAFGDDGKGEGEARKPISDFHKMHMGATPEEQDAIAEKMEGQFGDLSLQGATNKVLKEGGLQAQAAAKAFGYLPPEEGQSGKAAFKTREQALSDYNVDMDSSVEKGAAETKKQNQRRAMGGFLMDVGLRILASNRDDAGGAIGEGALGAIEGRRERNRQAKEDTIADEDRERKQRREDETDEARKVEASARADDRRIAAEETEYQKGQRGAKEAKDARNAMEQATNDNGEMFFVDPLDPENVEYVLDQNGERVRLANSGLSLESIQSSTRLIAAARTRARESIEKDLKDYDTKWPEIAEMEEGQEKVAAIDALVDKQMKRDQYPVLPKTQNN